MNISRIIIVIFLLSLQLSADNIYTGRLVQHQHPSGDISISLFSKFFGHRKFHFNLTRTHNNTFNYQDLNAAAGLSISGNQLRIFFPTINKRRQHRYFALIAKKNSNSFKLASASSYFTKSCTAIHEHEISEHPRENRISNTKYIDISTDADHEFYQAWGSESNLQIQSLLNAAEVIFARDLNLRFDLNQQNVFKTEDQPYLSNNPLGLLQEFRAYTNLNSQLGFSDAYLLFSGKTLDQVTLGISFIGQVCRDLSRSYSVIRRSNPALDALVTAHEIGHLIGATHPEDTLNNPATSLMTGIVSSSNNSFSDFSKTEINSYLSINNSCLSNFSFPETTFKIYADKYISIPRIYFRAISKLSEVPITCSWNLYASEDSEKITDPLFYLNTRLITSKNLTNGRKVIKANLRKGSRRGISNAFFRSTISCGNSIRSSDITSVRLHNYPSGTLRKFFNDLRRALK